MQKFIWWWQTSLVAVGLYPLWCLYKRWQRRKSRSITTSPASPTADKIRINFGVKNVSIVRSFTPMYSVSSWSVTFSGKKTLYCTKVNYFPNVTKTLTLSDLKQHLSVGNYREVYASVNTMQINSFCSYSLHIIYLSIYITNHFTRLV